MRKHFRRIAAFLTLAAAILACALPVPSTGRPTATASSSPDTNEVGKVVALTLTALAPTENSPTAPAVVTATSASTALLPHMLYYLAPDSKGITQIFRIERDGTTRRQITSEAVNVTDYDVSPVDGSVAYIIGTHLVYDGAGGTDHRVLMDGGTLDPKDPFISTVSSPVFAPDGRTIAYGYTGLRIYSFATNKSQLIIRNQIDTLQNGLLVPRELYAPERYSPDGTKLLVTVGYYEGASSAIYDLAAKALTRLDGGQGAVICCDDVEWSADSSSIYAASPTLGMFMPGLWRVEAATGKVTTLIQAEVGDGNYNLADEAYLAPDGQLYFFYATAPISPAEGAITRSPLRLVRSAPDGVTRRTALSQEDFQLLNEALWAPDASFVVAALASTPEVYQGGQAEIVYLDGRPNVVLVPFAQQMKWGP